MYDKREFHVIEAGDRRAEVYRGEDGHWHIDYSGPDRPCDHEVDSTWDRGAVTTIACAFVNGAARPDVPAQVTHPRW